MRRIVVFGAVCFLVLVLMIHYTLAASPAPKVSWSKTYGGENYDEANSVIQTSDGGYALAGYTGSYGVWYDFWLVKTDSSGNEEWNKTFGGENNDLAYSVIQTSDGGYVIVGCTESYGAGNDDFWLVKTDSSGNEEWNKTFGGENTDLAYSVIQTSDGGYIIVGDTWSYSVGKADFWLVKTDSSGNEEWNKTFGGENWDTAHSVIQTSDGGYALAGHTEHAGEYDFWLVKTDSSGNEEWSENFGSEGMEVAFSVIQTSDGGYALAGYSGFYAAGGSDFWLVKTDSSGNKEWSENFGGSSEDGAYSVIQTSDGGYALVGDTYARDHVGDPYAGDYNFLLVKTDSSGNEEWSETFGGENWDQAYSVIQTSDGGYALAGYTQSYGVENSDFWLVKLSGPKGEEYIFVVAGVIIVVIVALAMILYKRFRR